MLSSSATPATAASTVMSAASTISLTPRARRGDPFPATVSLSSSAIVVSVSVRVVPDVAVTARAGELAHLGVRALDGLHDRLVAGAARALGDLVVELVDADRLVEPADGEVERVPEAVARLGVVLPDEAGRRVA